MTFRIPSDHGTLLHHLEGAGRVLSGNQPDRIAWRIGSDTGRVRGDRPLARFAALPGLHDPRVLLPLGTSTAGLRASLRQQTRSATNPAVRLTGRLLDVAAALGIAEPMMRQRLSVEAVDRSLDKTPLHQFLSVLFGGRNLSLTLRLAPGRPNSKPVVQVADYSGSVLAYAKFGWEPLTRRLIRYEAGILRALAGLTAGTPVTVPSVLHAGPWEGLETLVVAPLESDGKTPRDVTDIPAAAIRCLAETGKTTRARLGESNYWSRTKSRIETLSPLLSAEDEETLCEAMQSIERVYGDMTVSFGLQHGDWIPPNMAIRRDGGVNLWDWERGSFDAPRGIDCLQFILFGITRHRAPRRTLIRRLGSLAGPALERQGVAGDLFALLACLSLMETTLWFGEASQAGRQALTEPRYTEALRTVLKDLVPP